MPLTLHRRLIALCLLLLPAVPFAAQTTPSLQGELVYANGAQPTSSAHIWIYEERTFAHYEAQPDNATSKFSVNLPPGVYAIFVSAPGYLPYAKAFTLKGDDHITLKVGMAPDPNNPANE